MKKFISVLLMVTIFSVVSILGSLPAFAEGTEEKADVDEVLETLEENIDEIPVDQSDDSDSSKEENSEEEATEENSTEEEATTDEDDAETDEMATEEETEEATDDEKTGDKEEATDENEVTDEEELTSDEEDDKEEVEADEEIDEEVDVQLEKIIAAFAKHYGMDEEEAAYEIEILMEMTDESGGIYYISEEGSLVFEYSVLFEVRKDGTLLVNGENISGEISEMYGLSENEVNEFMIALLDELQNDETFTIEYSDDDKIIFSYTTTIEIDKDGVMYIDDEEILVDEVEEIVAEKGDDINPIKVVAEEKNALPKTGEESSNTLIYIGSALIVLGLGFIVYKKRFLNK